MGLSLVLMLVAQAQMGFSWRIGIDEKNRSTLVTNGLFGLSRTTIFLSLCITLLGLFFLQAQRPDAGAGLRRRGADTTTGEIGRAAPLGSARRGVHQLLPKSAALDVMQATCQTPQVSLNLHHQILHSNKPSCCACPCSERRSFAAVSGARAQRVGLSAMA